MALPHHIHLLFFFSSIRTIRMHYTVDSLCGGENSALLASKLFRCAVWRHFKFNIAIALITTVTCAIITAIAYLHSNVNIGHASTSLSILLTLRRTHLGALRRNNGNAHMDTVPSVRLHMVMRCIRKCAAYEKAKSEIRWELWRESNEQRTPYLMNLTLLLSRKSNEILDLIISISLLKWY